MLTSITQPTTFPLAPNSLAEWVGNNSGTTNPGPLSAYTALVSLMTACLNANSAVISPFSGSCTPGSNIQPDSLYLLNSVYLPVVQASGMGVCPNLTTMGNQVAASPLTSVVLSPSTLAATSAVISAIQNNITTTVINGVTIVQSIALAALLSALLAISGIHLSTIMLVLYPILNILILQMIPGSLLSEVQLIFIIVLVLGTC